MTAKASLQCHINPWIDPMRPALLLMLFGTALAQADITASAPGGFVSEYSLHVGAPRERVFRALTSEIGRWWDPAHSYSGDAAHFTLDAHAGGCFCEQLDNGVVVHMTVVYVDANTVLRMRGGLGPLQAMAVTGSMTFTLQDEESGTRLLYRYAVGGYAPEGLEPYAEPVDRVQGGQLQRLVRYVETGQPDQAR
jgi:uncharacterized protein YndB with AHSA1/START domain